MRSIKRSFMAAGIALYAAASLSGAAGAASAPKVGQALEISPVTSELSVNPGQTVTIPVRIHNISQATQVVTAREDDFMPSGETGLPKILPDTDGTSQYSFKNWTKLPPSFRIVAREIRSVNVVVTVPLTATPGSHYGIIRFTASPPGLEGQGVSISTSIGLLAILRVSGDVKEHLSVAELSISDNSGKKGTFFEGTPLTFTERLKNDGNSDEQPVGNIEIRDLFGKLVAYVPVNQPPHLILPGSIRRFDEILDYQTLGTKKLFGRYTAKMNLTYGTSKTPLIAEVTFWVIPWKLIIAVLFGIVLLIVLFRVFRNRINIEISAKPKKRKRR